MTSGKIMLDVEKYTAAFIYLLSSMGKIEGKKKAYKLMYFLDFDFFEAYEKPFMGETYKALPMGPAPCYFDVLASNLHEEKTIDIKAEKKALTHDNDTIIYIPKKSKEYAFSKEEKKMMDRIVRVYGNQTGKQLEDLSHSQAPYKAVDIGDVIPYEYSFYRETADLTD